MGSVNSVTGTSPRHSAVPAYLVSRSVAHLGGAISGTILPVIVVVTLEGTAGEVGGILVLTLVVSLAARIVMAPRVDRHRRQVTLQVRAQILAAAAACGLPLLWACGWLSYTTLIGAVILMDLTQSLVQTCGHATVNKLVRPEERGTVIGWLNSLSSAAGIVGQSGAPVLIKFVPPPMIMLFDAAANVVSAVLLWPLRRWDTTTESSHAHHGDSVAVADKVDAPASFLTLTRTALRFRPLWVLWGFVIANSVVAPAVLIYITRVLGVPVEAVGIIFAIGAIGGIIGGLVVGKALTVLSARTVVLGSAGMGFVSAISLFAASQWASVMYPLLVLYEFGSAFSGTLVLAAVTGWLQVSSTSTTVARTLTVASTGLELSGLLGVAIGSLIADATTIRTAVGVSCGMYAALFIITAIVMATRCRPDQRSSNPD